MKKIIIAVVMIGFLVVAGSGWATPLTITVNQYGGYYNPSTGGGEFSISGFGNATNLYNANAIVNGGFESFCLEFYEYVNPGSQYNAEISETNTTTTGNTISQGTAYLYSLFAQGQLSGYNYGNVTTNYSDPTGRYASAAALQQTIWWLEGEITYRPTNRIFYNLVASTFSGASNARLNVQPGNNYGVSVLNLTTLAGGNAQDQLLYSVPEPATMLLLGLGLIGLAGVRKKFKA